jgi:hypothetical protein
MTEIESILTQLAVDLEGDSRHGWEVQTNSAVTRVTAGTAETYEAPEAAVEAALALRRALLDASLGERYRCAIGAEAAAPGEGWRGTDDLGLVTR